MKIVFVAGALALAGCSEPVYMWNKSGDHSFQKDSDACKTAIIKRIKETPPNYILPEGNHYQRGHEWEQVEYNQCMRNAGYTETREMTSSEAAGSRTPPKPSVAPATATTPPSSVSMNMAGRLRELRGLLDQGLISQAEYDQRRQAILSQM